MPALSLEHLVQQPRTASAAPPLLIMLHGVGSNERDLFGLAAQLDTRFLTLSVRAPLRMGADNFGWYLVDWSSGTPQYDPAQVAESQHILRQFIADAVPAYGADAARVYLMGFSQGAIMSASLTLTHPDLVAGAVLMSGRTLPEAVAARADDAALAGTPIFIAHGTADTVLPVSDGRRSRDIFSALPVDVTYREYPMAHTISPQSLADIAAWLTACLDG